MSRRRNLDRMQKNTERPFCHIFGTHQQCAFTTKNRTRIVTTQRKWALGTKGKLSRQNISQLILFPVVILILVYKTKRTGLKSKDFLVKVNACKNYTKFRQLIQLTSECHTCVANIRIWCFLIMVIEDAISHEDMRIQKQYYFYTGRIFEARAIGNSVRCFELFL